MPVEHDFHTTQEIGRDDDQDATSVNSKFDTRDYAQSFQVQDAASTASNPYLESLDANIDEEEEDSPYPEVRSAVANYDDPDMPCSTIRAWTIGLLWASILPGLNQLLYLRYPSVTVPTSVAILLSFPLGKLWARFMPAYRILGLSLNPGPFTIKEHVLIMIMSGVGDLPAYATNILAVQKIYYKQQWSWGYQWLLVTSTNLIGFSAGGITRRFLVDPPSMIWPQTLVQAALFNTLHSQQYSGMRGRPGTMSREKFFSWIFLGGFLWYFLPGYLFQFLSYFNWVCWIAPNHVKVNQLFGYFSGVGMSLLTFDWAQLVVIRSPLVAPWWSQANVTAGFIAFFWIITPILYYANVFDAQYMPMFSRGLFDNRGKQYNLSRILNADATINLEAYHHYSPVFLSATYFMAYAVSFASITALVTYTLLYLRAPILKHMRTSLPNEMDIHARLMSAYKQVPCMWFICILVANFAFAVAVIKVWPTDMPLWALLLALLLATVFLIPVGMVEAISFTSLSTPVISELIVGFLLPGRPIANMLFKTYGYISLTQALVFTTNFKLGHYMKIPPRAMFSAQLVAAVVAGTVQLAVQTAMFAFIPEICNQDARHGFTCLNQQVFGTASIFWGVVGPSKQFAQGRFYYGLVFFFLFGAMAPLIVWMGSRLFRKRWIDYIHMPILLGGQGFIPQAPALNYVPSAIVGFIFQYYIRRRRFLWWAKYNYVLSASLDAGTAVAIFVIFMCLRVPMDGNLAGWVNTWWPNTVFTRTADFKMTPLRSVPAGQTFGPSHW